MLLLSILTDFVTGRASAKCVSEFSVNNKKCKYDHSNKFLNNYLVRKEVFRQIDQYSRLNWNKSEAFDADGKRAPELSLLIGQE